VTVDNALTSLVDEVSGPGEATLFLGRAVESAVDSKVARPTEELGHRFLEFDATVREANTSALEAREVADGLDLKRMNRSLAGCMRSLESALGHLDAQSEEASHAVEDVRFDDEWHQDQWQKLMSELSSWIKECRVRLSASRQALMLVWEEIADRSGAANLTVSTTNVGLQLTGERESTKEPSHSANG